MVTLSIPTSISRFTQVAGLSALLALLQAPVHAQSANPVQQLFPDESEFRSPAGFQSTYFGDAVAHQGDTALIQESGYPDERRIGRVAVFRRNSDGTWVRNGSIDPPNGQPFDQFGSPLAIFDDVALIGSTQGMYVFHRKHGQWRRVQHLRLKTPWLFTDVALNRNFAFLATQLNGQGVVYAYRIRGGGRLDYLQRLDSGVDFDGFAERLALSGDTVVVSAVADDHVRGAAYVFERRGLRWMRQQKLVAIDGTPGDAFGVDVAISNDRIAIGAPGVQGLRDLQCEGGRLEGAVYVFRRINGTWQHEDVLLAEEVLSAGGFCWDRLGQDLVMSGPWLVANAVLPSHPAGDVVGVIYRREAGHYTPVDFAGGGGPAARLHLSRSTLFVGTPVEHGCQFEFCMGSAVVIDLDETIP
jgi:hypothetical protein